MVEVACPLCDRPMYQLRRPPVQATYAGHALWLANRVVFYACPDREQPGHRAMVADFHVADAFWGQPLTKLLRMRATTLLRKRGCP